MTTQKSTRPWMTVWMPESVASGKRSRRHVARFVSFTPPVSPFFFCVPAILCILPRPHHGCLPLSVHSFAIFLLPRPAAVLPREGTTERGPPRPREGRNNRRSVGLSLSRPPQLISRPSAPSLLFPPYFSPPLVFLPSCCLAPI